MPVLNDSAASSAALPLGNATSGNTSASINVNPNAPNLYAVAALLWTGGVDASGATFGVTFGGTPMDELVDDDDEPVVVTWNSNHHLLKPFSLFAPPTGSGKTVTASFSGMGTEAPTRDLTLVVATYSGVDSVSGVVTAGNSSPMVNSVTVDSVKPAHRVVTIHAIGGTNTFLSYNKALRAHRHAAGIAGGDLLIGDAPGAATITGTTTELVTLSALWGAIGFNLLPAIVALDAALSLSPLSLNASAGLFRAADPPPERFWQIPAEPHTYPAGLEPTGTSTGNCGC